MEQQQGRMRQLDFLKELEASVLGHDRRGGGGTAARRCEERQMPTAPDRKRALTFDLCDVATLTETAVVRSRMSGGVGGGVPRGPSLSRSWIRLEFRRCKDVDGRVKHGHDDM